MKCKFSVEQKKAFLDFTKSTRQNEFASCYYDDDYKCCKMNKNICPVDPE